MIEVNEYLNQTVVFECTIINLLYPKIAISEFKGGDFGIISVNTTKIIEGKIPNEMNISFDVEPSYRLVIKGHIPKIYFDKIYHVECECFNDEKYGLSFEVKNMNIISEITKQDEQRMYIEYALGEKKCNLLYSYLIDPYHTLLIKDFRKLCCVKGIKLSIAQKLIEKFHNKLNDAKNIVELKFKYELTDKMIDKLVEKYKSTDTILDNLRNNPYIVMEIDGIGWKKADTMALQNNYPKSGEFRVRAYVEYYLNNLANNEGHSWITLNMLVASIKEAIPEVEKEKLAFFLKKWTGRSEYGLNPFLYYDEKTKRIGLLYYRNLEENICREIMRIKNSEPYKYNKEELDKIISHCENKNGFKFTEEQRDAIYGCFDNNFVIITGKAGVGKTSIMEPISMYIKSQNMKIAQVALAGKAASNLSEVTGEEGQTIHRLLGYDPYTGDFYYGKDSKLDLDLIILDEFSLLGGQIFYSLIQAIPQNCKVIAIGDTAQLESIGMANLLKDCIDSNVIPYYRLSKIHRQASRSAIITESIKISNGEKIIGNCPVNEVRGDLQDLKLYTYNSAEESRGAILKEYQYLLKNGNSIDDITIIVPMRTRGDISCLSLNKSIQEIINCKPSASWSVTKDGYTYTLKLGDRVINTKNNYDTCSVDGDMIPIYNGNIGKVVEIIPNEYIVVDFSQQGKIIIPKECVSDIELAYAITAHKMQGSQNKCIIVGLDMSAYVLMSKEWLYTAITRAKKYCILTGQISAIRKAITISRVNVKQNWLKELLINNKKIS